MYLNCPSFSLTVYLLPGGHSRDITVNDSSAEFYNLDCNREYTPNLRGAVGGVSSSDNGNLVFFGSKLISSDFLKHLAN